MVQEKLRMDSRARRLLWFHVLQADSWEVYGLVLTVGPAALDAAGFQSFG